MGWTLRRETYPENIRIVFNPRWGTGGGQPSLPLRHPPHPISSFSTISVSPRKPTLTSSSQHPWPGLAASSPALCLDWLCDL